MLRPFARMRASEENGSSSQFEQRDYLASPGSEMCFDGRRILSIHTVSTEA
jgi:hypothetical protein